jgi:iron complex outermembrane receptor protein
MYAASGPAMTVASVVALMLGAATAPAQQTQDEAQNDASALEEVVVSARYREENLQETPIAITAITADDLAERAFTSAAEVAYTVPNASFRPAQAAFGNTMTAFIRGIGQNDFNFAFEPGVGVYVDDVYYPTTMGSMIDLLDLERVEVLRGPQGTLFGRGSIGGALRFVTKAPRGDNTGYVQATVGQFDRVDIRAGYDFPLVEEKLFARVSGMSKQREGYQKIFDFACVNPAAAGSIPTRSTNRFADCQVGTAGGEDVVGARASVRWVASEAVEMTFTADYQNDSSETRANTLVDTNVLPGTSYETWSNAMVQRFGVPYDDRFVTGNPYASYATWNDPISGLAYPPLTSLEQQGISAVTDWSMTETVSAKLILSWRDFDSLFANDHDGSPLNLQMVDGRQSFISRTAELRFSGLAMQQLEWTVGAFYYDGDATSGQGVSFPAANGAVLANYLADPQGNPLLVNGRDVSEFGNESVYFHSVYNLTDAMRITAGARYSSDDKGSDFDNTIVQATLDSSDDRFDYRLGFDYQFSDDVLVYTSASTGYRPQAFNPRPFQPSQFVAVDGEELTAYEIGVKTDFFDRRVRLNTALFFSDYEQRIVPQGGVECVKTPDGTPVPPPAGQPGVADPEGGPNCLGTLPRTRYVNAPGEISGIEMEVAFRPLDALTITGNAGFIDWSSDDIDDNPLIVNDRPNYVPEWNASLAAQYVLPLANGASLTPRVDTYFQSEICTASTTRTSCADGYNLTNARLEYATSARAWSMSLGVTNLTGEDYFLNIFDLTSFGQPTIEGQPGRPREWYFQVVRNFE